MHLRAHETYVRGETLADKLDYGVATTGAHIEDIDVNGMKTRLGVVRSS